VTVPVAVFVVGPAFRGLRGGGTVQYILDSTPVANAPVEQDGWARGSFVIPATTTAGIHILSAVYSGFDGYPPCRIAAVVTITK